MNLDATRTKARPAAQPGRARSSSDRIGPDDPRYGDLTAKRFNKRFFGRPDYYRLVGSTEATVEAVQDAVREGLRLVAQSGGHGLEGFVAEPDVRVVIDTSPMSGVAYDPDMAAFAVEAGTTVGEMVRKLYLGWGVTVPAGESPEIGVGGHILGGAFGFFCREHGLAVDHLYGVEVVVVDETGSARTVVATREPSDPNRELWWAHTGGGGGNFGIVTRYWFRSPGGPTNPEESLPRAPASATIFRAEWSWDDVDESAFTRLAGNFGAWCEENSDPDSPLARLFGTLFLRRRPYGKVELKGLSTAGPEAEQLIEQLLAAVRDGVDASYVLDLERRTWLGFALDPFPELFRAASGDTLLKGKDAFLRKSFTNEQLAIAHRHLAPAGSEVPGGMLGLATYGGRVNAVDQDATASPQRDSILTTACVVGWQDPAEEARSLAWVRALYRELFADTGGVPVPGERYDGAMINHPDVDLADPDWNASGVPWHAFYYKHNYPRLQRVKARWDPLDVFRHALSIRADRKEGP